MIAGALAKIFSLFGTLFTWQVAKTAMWKMFVFLAVGAIVPWVTYLGINAGLGVFAEWLVEKVESINIEGGVPSPYLISGTAAYLFNQLGLYIAFSMIISAVSARIAVRSIPFMRNLI